MMHGVLVNYVRAFSVYIGRTMVQKVVNGQNASGVRRALGDIGYWAFMLSGVVLCVAMIWCGVMLEVTRLNNIDINVRQIQDLDSRVAVLESKK